MAGAANVVNPSTGEKGSVSDEKLNRARAAGARRMTDEEASTYVEQKKHDQSITEPFIAQSVGKVRGIGEAFGVPTDQIATAIGGQETRDYLNDLKKNQPFASEYGEIAGQVGGSIAAGELLGPGDAGAKVGSLGSRIVKGAPGMATRGALENLVIGSTHDVNETQLGNSDLAGEKLLPRMLTHAGVGAAGGLVGGVAGETIGHVWSSFAQKAPAALEAGADRLVGREFGGGAELGAEVRAAMGGKVPKSQAEVVDALTREQAIFRGKAEAAAIAERESLLTQHTTDAWKQSAKQEAARLEVSKEAKKAFDELTRQQQVAREALSLQHEEAASAAVKLGEERAAARNQLRNLASDLDKVKGATKPNPQNIIRTASEAFQGPTLTPPSPRAQQLFNEWTQTFQTRFSEPGSLSFKDLQGAIKSLETMETRQRVVSGWGSDPEVKKAFDALRSAAKSEFDAASEATAASVSEAKGLSAAQLRERVPTLDKAHRDALDNVDTIQKSILDFDKKAAQEVRFAQREAAKGTRDFERGMREEDRALGRSQKADEKGLPKASKSTPVDTLLGKVKSKPAEPASQLPQMSALLGLLHGNVAGAAVGLISGFAANTAKAQGNLLAARTLSSLAEHLASSDAAIAKIASKAVGRYARQGAASMVNDDRPKRKELTFEKAAKQVREQQANPLILEAKVRNAAGPWAKDAPSVYQAMLAAAQRQQEFLATKLPPSRVDPYSLTPHLEEDDLSDSEKYDFVQYAKAGADPIAAMQDVVEGNGSPQQVEAVAAIYPGIYKQTKAEVRRRLSELQSPLDYDRMVNIGTLLQMDTSEVMTGEFQSMLADMYSAREKSEEIPGGSKPLGVNSRLSKSTASAGQMMGTTGEG